MLAIPEAETYVCEASAGIGIFARAAARTSEDHGWAMFPALPRQALFGMKHQLHVGAPANGSAASVDLKQANPGGKQRVEFLLHHYEDSTLSASTPNCLDDLCGA